MQNIEIIFFMVTVVTLIVGGYAIEFRGAISDWSNKILGKPTTHDLIGAVDAAVEGEAKNQALRDIVNSTNWRLVDGLTPVSQKIAYRIFMLVAWIVIPICAANLFPWWSVPLMLVLNYYIVGFLRKLFPPSTSPYYLQKIIKGLHSKKSACERKGDLVGAEVYAINLSMIDGFCRSEMMNGK